MKVIKRNNQKEEISFDKVIKRLQSLCNNLSPKLDIDVIKVAQKVVSQIYDNVRTSELDELSARICVSLITQPCHTHLPSPTHFEFVFVNIIITIVFYF